MIMMDNKTSEYSIKDSQLKDKARDKARTRAKKVVNPFSRFLISLE